MVGSRLLHLKDETVIALIWKAHEGGPAISLSACDGESVWTCIVDVVLKPKNQSALTEQDYMLSIADALGQAHPQYIIDMDIDANKSDATLTIKKKIEGSTSQLMWCKVVMNSHNSRSHVLAFVCALVDHNSVLQTSVGALTAKNDSLKIDLQTLADDFDIYRKEHEEFKKTMVTKTCLLLNTKKAEIARLQAEVEQYQNKSSSSAVLTDEVVKPKGKAKRRKIENADIKDESHDSEHYTECSDDDKRPRTKAPPRTRGTRNSKVIKPNKRLGSLPNSDESDVLGLGKSGTLEITGADIDSMLSQPLSMQASGSQSQSYRAQTVGRAGSSTTTSSDGTLLDTSANTSQAVSSSQGDSSKSISSLGKKTSTKINSLKSMIDSDEEEDDLMSCLY